MKPMRVCIVGAGVSGLATAKVFLSQGHDVAVFEKVGHLGGVWSPSRRYPGLRVQTVRDCYAFSDFPMPAHYPEFPGGEQVHEYFLSYAKHFGVLERIRFGREVVRIGKRPDRQDGWRVDVRDVADGSVTAHDFDFVVVCTGVYSEPNVPQLPGRAEFEANGGIVLHSSEVGTAPRLQDRNVVVVGFGKSALDLAEASLAVAKSTSIVCRRVPWKVPHRIWGRVHIKYFILSRFSEIWQPHPEMGRARRILHSAFRPLVDFFWRITERIIGGQVGLRESRLRPDIPLRRSVPCVTLAIDNLKSIHDGRLALHRGAIGRFTADGLELDDGKKIEANVVVLATGYKQQVACLEDKEKSALFDAAGAILLYRSLINPDIPHMAFNGYNGVGACQLTAEVGASWLVRFVEGRISAPDRMAMLAAIRSELDLRARLLSSQLTGGTYVSPFTFSYLDQLLRDLGLPPADRKKPLFKWLFDPLDPADYRDLLNRTDIDTRQIARTAD